MQRKLIAAATAIALGITMTTTGAIAFGGGGGHGGGGADTAAVALAAEADTAAVALAEEVTALGRWWFPWRWRFPRLCRARRRARLCGSRRCRPWSRWPWRSHLCGTLVGYLCSARQRRTIGDRRRFSGHAQRTRRPYAVAAPTQQSRARSSHTISSPRRISAACTISTAPALTAMRSATRPLASLGRPLLGRRLELVGLRLGRLGRSCLLALPLRRHLLVRLLAL